MSLLRRALLRRFPTLASIPGPTPRFPLGNLGDLAHGKPWLTSVDYARRFGPYALLWIGDQPAIFIHDPAAIETILVTETERFIKREPVAAMRPAATASNIFIANGAPWADRRRRDFFSCERGAAAWLEGRFQPTQAFLGRRLEALQRGEHRGFERDLYRLVFDLQSFLSFGRRLPEADFRAYNRMADVVDLRMKANLPLVTPRFRSSIRRWHRAIDGHLAICEDDPSGRALAHVLARSSDLPRAELVTELANIYPGGVFSMTIALLQTLACLSADGRARDRLIAALRALDDGSPVTYAAICGCAELEAALREALRLHPPVPVFMRSVRADAVKLGPYRVPAGVRLMIGSLPLHRDRERWQHADEFIPERWTPAVIAQNPYGSGHFFPFGRGPRTCAGEALALFVLRSALYHLLASPGPTIEVTAPTEHRFYFGCKMPRRVRATVAD
ncbi:MAG: cytochrome P450 [Myxococcales bacterium]|nr:cytochrome P450 [Myxococcales bacterium]